MERCGVETLNRTLPKSSVYRRTEKNKPKRPRILQIAVNVQLDQVHRRAN